MATVRILCILLCALIAVKVQCWVMRINKNPVTSGLTTNVTIRCELDTDMDAKTNIKQIYRMAIKKINANQQWSSVAHISRCSSRANTSLPTGDVQGNLQTIADSYIQLHFNIASEDTIGQFSCEIAGEDISEMTIETTEPVMVTEKAISYSDIVDAVSGIKCLKSKDQNYATSEISGLKDHFDITGNKLQMLWETIEERIEGKISFVVANFTESLNKLGKQLRRFSKEMNEKENLKKSVDSLDIAIANLTKEINEMRKTSEQVTEKTPELKDDPEPWPAGQYSLLAPKSGCPDTLKTMFQHSAIRISTQPGNMNSDKSSKKLNLNGTVFQEINNRRYVNLEMCSKVTQADGFSWPVGSYCLQHYSSDGNWGEEYCPAGLHYGWIQYGRYNDGKKDDILNFPGLATPNTQDFTYIFYCCRTDGSPSNPIILPSRRPFYLYRYGGECQRVEGMDVSPQWIRLDTNSNHDNTYQYHPDGFIKNGVKVELCYYSPKI